MEIEGEKAYPIYSVSATWIDVQLENLREYRRDRDKPLPDDRCFNSTGFDKMFAEEQSPEALQAFLDNWWISYKTKKDEKGVWLLPKLKIRLLRHDVWNLTWFCHQTFDDGRSDSEYLASFRRFVDRMELLNSKKQHEEGRDAYCLMGAEDRWRWRGENDDRDNPICRCNGCKEQGVVRINH